MNNIESNKKGFNIFNFEIKICCVFLLFYRIFKVDFFSQTMAMQIFFTKMLYYVFYFKQLSSFVLFVGIFSKLWVLMNFF